MPRHVVVSPEEDLASFYGSADPIATTGAKPAGFDRPLPVAPAMAAPAPPPVASPPPMTAPPPPPPQRQAAPAPSLPAPAPVATPTTSGTDPVLAAILSLLLPGVGQLIIGQTAKGALLLAIGLLSCGMGGVLNVVAAIDAYLIAGRLRRGETIQDWQFF